MLENGLEHKKAVFDMRKSKRRSSLIKKILVAIVLLIALIALLFFIEHYPGALDLLTKKPKMYPVQDRCSIILNRLLHQIKDEGECRIACRNECEIRSEKFDSSEFVEKENSCNICNCYCK
ncbi:hypothetical protein A3K73_07790 [Candidatus Pacearchaeota archaeon RBG_13_36_9]|nr:MAG: hypothetical protein A3K73_07790 [Candidatus Pacearchaeota archaeon RBG_13_36_9]